jgi:F-type H+-transporting ATPase subunit a
MEDGIEVIWNIPGLDIPITNVVVMSWIVMAVIILWAWLSTSNMKLVPRGLQKTAEIVVETLNNFAVNIIGEKSGRSFAPYLGTIGLFLGISNMAGALFMSELTGGIIGPSTRGLAIPVALAIMTILLAVGAGLYKRGIKGYIKRLFSPLPIMFPFNLLEFIIKPLSLSMRLFGNILGAYILMEMLLSALPYIVPGVACLYFDIFDGGLQAFVFVLLTSLYISEEVGEKEEE